MLQTLERGEGLGLRERRHAPCADRSADELDPVRMLAAIRRAAGDRVAAAPGPSVRRPRRGCRRCRCGDSPCSLDVGDRGRSAAKREIGSLIHRLDCEPAGRRVRTPPSRRPAGGLRSEGAACAVVKLRSLRAARPSIAGHAASAYRFRTPRRASAATLVFRSTKTPIQNDVSGGKRLARERTIAWNRSAATCASWFDPRLFCRRRIACSSLACFDRRKSRRTPRSCSATALRDVAARDAPMRCRPHACLRSACTFLKLRRISFGATTRGHRVVRPDAHRGRPGQRDTQTTNQAPCRRPVEHAEHARPCAARARSSAARAAARAGGIAVMQLAHEGGEARELHVQVADGAERADQGLPCRTLADESSSADRARKPAV